MIRYMKKKLFLAITIIAFNCNMIFAQGYKYNIDSSDGFFSIDNRWEDSRTIDNMDNIIKKNTRSDSVSIGNAWILLSGMGIAYGLIRRKGMAKD